MAMKKADMEAHYFAYVDYMKQVRHLERKGLFSKAMEKAFEAWELVDGMRQYARKYKEQEFNSVEAIEFVLKYAPMLFDFERLDCLEGMLKSCKRIEKNTSVNLAKRLSETRGIVKKAHKLWNYLEYHPETRQNQLAKLLGGDQDQWRAMAETWEKMGLLSRQKKGNSYRLNIQTRMDAITQGKCSECGSIQEAPKAMFLETLTCPDCRNNTNFVIMTVE